MNITEKRVSLTASWLRDVVRGQATNPASRPVIKAMADATSRRDWASLRVLAGALYDLESLTCGLDGSAARNVAARAAEFSWQAMRDAHRDERPGAMRLTYLPPTA